MEKMIIYGIVAVVVFVLVRKMIACFKNGNGHGCACSSGGSCGSTSDCGKESSDATTKPE